MTAAAALVALWLGLVPSSSGAAAPDWTAIQYGDGVGCGLFVQFFVANGTEPTVGGRPTAFFPGGAPPSMGESNCLGNCREWADSSIVKTLAAGYRKNLGVTGVTGTCYLQRRPLGQPQAIATD